MQEQAQCWGVILAEGQRLPFQYVSEGCQKLDHTYSSQYIHNITSCNKDPVAKQQQNR